MDDNGAENVLLWISDTWPRHDKSLREARSEIFRLLVEEDRHYLTTKSLDPPSYSAWMILYESGDAVSFLSATSLTKHGRANSNPCAELRSINFSAGSRASTLFLFHLQDAALRNDVITIKRYLVLCFYATLCLLFGVPPSTLVRTLRRAEEALALTLKDFAPARIAWPSPARQVEMVRLTEAREPLLSTQSASSTGKQSGCEHLEYSIFVFTPYTITLALFLACCRSCILLTPTKRT
ncbi:hypothetical protein GQ600_24926 [Phytophthora cactorum]|nr:hypothetical protein GQ600_24926 [Phytophthora cactorum]